MSRPGYLTESGFIIPAAFLRAHADILAELTIHYTPKIGRAQVTNIYSRRTVGKAECIVLPRGMISTLLSRGIIDRMHISLAPGRPIAVEMQIQIYDNQAAIVNYLMTHIYTPDRLAAGTATAVLNLRAGMGKTFVAAALIARLGLSTLYIVPKRNLAAQATKDISACLRRPGEGRPVGITVAVINTVMKQADSYFDQFGLIIYDEVHTYCTKKRQAVFRHCTWAALGMSATTEDRADGADKIMLHELAPDGVTRAENVPGFTYGDVAFTAQVDMIHYRGPTEYTKNITHPSTGEIFTPWMLKQFIEDPYRQALALREIQALYDWVGPQGQQHGIYVFCEEREPLAALFEAINRANVDVAAPELTAAGQFIGGIKDTAAEHIAQSARVILSTYGYGGTGVSIDRMTAIVFLTPRKANMKQILARILRRGGDLSIRRRIIDIVDSRTCLKYQAVARQAGYAFYGMDVVHRRVSYDDVKNINAS